MSHIAKYVPLINRDDPILCDKHDYCKELNQLEHDKARHKPPAVIDRVSGDHKKDHELTRWRKSACSSSSAALESLNSDQVQNHKALIEELKRGNYEPKKPDRCSRVYCHICSIYANHCISSI